HRIAGNRCSYNYPTGINWKPDCLVAEREWSPDELCGVTRPRCGARSGCQGAYVGTGYHLRDGHYSWNRFWYSALAASLTIPGIHRRWFERGYDQRTVLPCTDNPAHSGGAATYAL